MTRRSRSGENFSFLQSEHSDSIRAATPVVNESAAASEQRNNNHDLSPPSRKQPTTSVTSEAAAQGAAHLSGGADSLTRGASTNTQHPPQPFNAAQPPPRLLPRMTDGARPETSAFIGPHYPPAADPDGPDFYPTVLDLVISFFQDEWIEIPRWVGGGWLLARGGGYYL